ncbi:uncharacterized protein [Apostichopus japonicus]|uniref:uncharacterized protein isoform X2 n=1 Tax=Stichopus japonicus TaxID=307972 RepID=UPI003AB213E7
MDATEKHCSRHQNDTDSSATTTTTTKKNSRQQQSFAEVVKGDVNTGSKTSHSEQERTNVKERNDDNTINRVSNHGNKGLHNGFSRRPRAVTTSDDATAPNGDEKESVQNRKGVNSKEDDNSLLEFVETLEMEANRLKTSTEARDTSNLRRLLTDLSYTLENRHAESMKLCGDADEIREKLETVRKILQDQINIGREEKTTNSDKNEDNKVGDTKAQVSLSNARAALARLALEVSQTSQLAAEVELAAAQAAVMAEDAEKEAAKVDDVIHTEEGTSETDGAAELEEDEHTDEEEEMDERQGKMKADDTDTKVGEDKIQDEERIPPIQDGGVDEKDAGTEKRHSPEESQDTNSKQEIASDENDVTDDVTKEDGDSSESNKEQSRSSSQASRPPSSTSRPASQGSQHDETTELSSPRPSSSRSSQRSQKPLEWPHYPLRLSHDEDDSVIGCIIRSNDDDIEENPNMFTCRLAPDLSSSVVGDCEELVSDVIMLAEVTSEEDYSKDDDFEEAAEEEDSNENAGSDDKEDENIKDVDKEQTQHEKGDEEGEEKLDEKGEENGEEEGEKTEGKEATAGEQDVDLEGGTDDSGNQQKTRKREHRLVVAIPYTVTPRMASTRELVIKMKLDNEPTWSILPTLAQESVFPEHKGPFMEVRASRCGAFAVVARPLTDRVTITKKGGSLKSSIDARIALNYPEGISSLMTASLQVQPAEQAVSELKYRMKHCSDLISASPILHLTHSTPKEFEQPVSVTISCPPNPFKTSAVTSTKADEKQDRTDKPTMPPSREDGVIIRSTKSSIFGGDPSEDALHVLHRPLSAKSWSEIDAIQIKQIRKDIVGLNLDRPYDRLLVLRMTADCHYPVENVANTFERALQIKYSKIILAHKVDDLETAMVLCVPTRQVEGVLRKLANDGFEAPSEMTEELPLTEGLEIEMRATGNIKVVNHETVKLVFHSQRRCAVDLRLDVANKYGNYSSSDYRGMLEFYGTPKIVLHDMEDPEEVLLKEAEAKVEAKKGKKEEKKDKKGKENKEQVQNMTTASSNWLCKLPVALPKREKEVDLTQVQSRAPIADVTGLTSNTNLQWLATELGNEWESLANYLGIKSNRLQSIKRNFPSNQEAQIFNTLLTWRSRMPKSYDKERKLLRGLTKCGRYDLSEELKYRDDEMEEDESTNE